MQNAPHHNNKFKGFYMNNQGPKVNHLDFADDTIVFSNGSISSLNLIFNTLAMYERSLDNVSIEISEVSVMIQARP